MAKVKKSKPGKIAVVVSDFNKEVTTGLLNGAMSVLKDRGYDQKDVKIVRCPGAFEIPITAKALCASGRFCGVICLGAVIKGETAHFEYISYAVTHGIMQLNLEFGIPVSFGVLTAYDDKQAEARSSAGEGNKGGEAALACLEMIDLLKTI